MQDGDIGGLAKLRAEKEDRIVRMTTRDRFLAQLAGNSQAGLSAILREIRLSLLQLLNS